MKKDTVVANANSKGMVIDYFGASNSDSKYFQSRSPIFDPKNALTVVRNDPVVKASIVKVVDKVLESGWRIQGRDKKSRKEDLENQLKDVRFNKVLRKALFNLVLFKNAYIEIIKKGDKLSDLNVLETTLMKIRSLDNGDIKEYYQEVPSTVPGRFIDGPKWKPEQIVHLKLDEITSNVFSDDDIKVLWDTVCIKDAVREWLKWFFQTNQMRVVFAMKGAGNQKVKDFLSYLAAMEKDRTKHLPLEGELTVQLLQNYAEQGKTIPELLDWCDNQIIKVFQLPPIASGNPDASGRSNSVEQNNQLGTRVKAIHDVLEDDFTYDLFPKCGFEKCDFLFGTLDEISITQVFDTVQVMKNSMFTDEAIIEYMNSQGVVFSSDKVFNDPVEQAAEMAKASGKMMNNKSVGTGNEGSIGNKSADSAPSRQRQSNQTISKANQTRLVRNSVEDKFSQYPYTFEAKQ